MFGVPSSVAECGPAEKRVGQDAKPAIQTSTNNLILDHYDQNIQQLLALVAEHVQAIAKVAAHEAEGTATKPLMAENAKLRTELAAMSMRGQTARVSAGTGMETFLAAAGQELRFEAAKDREADAAGAGGGLEEELLPSSSSMDLPGMVTTPVQGNFLGPDTAAAPQTLPPVLEAQHAGADSAAGNMAPTVAYRDTVCVLADADAAFMVPEPPTHEPAKLEHRPTIDRKSMRGALRKLCRRSDENRRTSSSQTKSWLQRRSVLTQGLFADEEQMKEKVRQAIQKPDYNVTDFYKDAGFCQRLARHSLFDTLSNCVIFFNAIWIAVDLDFNKSEVILQADPVFQVFDNFFCVYFVSELLIRFGAFRNKRDSMRDGWFQLDTVLVAMIVLETWVMSLVVACTGVGGVAGMRDASILKLVRLIRLARMARMARLLRATPELLILIKGLWVAARSVLFTLCLLVIIIYVFAVAFKQLADDTDLGRRRFDTVLEAMGTLLLEATLPDLAPIVREAGGQSAVYAVLLLLFVLLASLTVMNMLVGVLVEVVSIVSSVEKEQMTVNYVKSKLLSMLKDADGDDSMTISRHEFEELIVMPEAANIIQDVGVDVVGLVDFADVIFEDDATLSFGEFMTMILQFRGSNGATVRDIVDLRKFFTQEMCKLRGDGASEWRIQQKSMLRDAGSSFSNETFECPALVRGLTVTSRIATQRATLVKSSLTRID